MKKLLTLSLCSLLAACGSGSENTDSNNAGDTSGGNAVTPVSDFVIGTVRPLDDAQVCADKNKNYRCDDSEVLGLTNLNGKFTVPGGYADTPLVVEVIENQTVDIKTGFAISKSYTMYADAGVKNVSPISTMSIDSGYTMTAIADMWGIDFGILSGNYTVDLEPYNAQAVLVDIAAKYSTMLLQNNISLMHVPNDVSLVVDYVFTALESGVEPSQISFELDENGAMYVSVPEVGAGTDEDFVVGEFIDSLSLGLLDGQWNAYSFGSKITAQVDAYGSLTIDASSATPFCLTENAIEATEPLVVPAEPECKTMTLGDFGLMHVDFNTQYSLLYGHTTDAGTALLFRVGKSHEDNLHGFMWIDNYATDLEQGMGLRGRDWYRAQYSALTNNSADQFDTAIFSVDFNEEVSVEYASGEVIEARFDYIEGSEFTRVFKMNQSSVVFAGQNHYHRLAAFRLNDYLGLSMHKRDEKLSLGLISRNPAIIESINESKMFVGQQEPLKTFTK